MTDKPTAELKADLREAREWVANNPRDFRVRDFKRRISEREAVLEARGEEFEPVPCQSREATRRRIYHAHRSPAPRDRVGDALIAPVTSLPASPTPRHRRVAPCRPR
jgi:hypothetical protein